MLHTADKCMQTRADVGYSRYIYADRKQMLSTADKPIQTGSRGSLQHIPHVYLD